MGRSYRIFISCVNHQLASSRIAHWRSSPWSCVFDPSPPSLLQGARRTKRQHQCMTAVIRDRSTPSNVQFPQTFQSTTMFTGNSGLHRWERCLDLMGKGRDAVEVILDLLFQRYHLMPRRPLRFGRLGRLQSILEPPHGTFATDLSRVRLGRRHRRRLALLRLGGRALVPRQFRGKPVGSLSQAPRRVRPCTCVRVCLYVCMCADLYIYPP